MVDQPETLRELREQVIMHRIAGELGKADLEVTEALMDYVHRLEIAQLTDSIAVQDIAHGKD